MELQSHQIQSHWSYCSYAYHVIPQNRNMLMVSENKTDEMEMKCSPDVEYNSEITKDEISKAISGAKKQQG